MKAVKAFVKTCYSEVLVSISSNVADNEREDGSLVSEEKAGAAAAGAHPYHGGLGLRFRFPGDPKKLREASKIKLWTTYLQNHGRNLTLLRYPQCTASSKSGCPTGCRARSGKRSPALSPNLRFANPGFYHRLLEEYKGQTSTSTEDIEKDLHRSLSEEQAFWLLEVLCDRLLPGYYPTSMHGTLLDERVFEALVARCLPIIHDHFDAVDVQLSVASLPWFLSLYINSMPTSMVFAFRIVDCFFCMGRKVLFQAG